MYSSFDGEISSNQNLVQLGMIANADGENSGGGSCSAKSYCGTGSGGSVSCTGDNSCTAGKDYVKCDGVKTKCSEE